MNRIAPRSRLLWGVALAAVVAMVVWLFAPTLLASCIRNDQVQWSGQFGLLVPSSSSLIPRLILLRGRDCAPRLRTMLNDDRKFVAAHVYLTWLFDEPITGGAGSYDDLTVTLYADGRVEIPTDQKPRLLQHWINH